MKSQSGAWLRGATLWLGLLLGLCLLTVDGRTGAGGVRWVSYAGRWSVAEEAFARKSTGGPSSRAAAQDARAASAAVLGLVVDARTRRPVAGARVSLDRGRLAAGRNAREKEPAASSLTDGRGRFRFEKIEPGVYRLAAAKAGYILSPPHVLELESGKTTAREISLDPLVKLSGRVLDESNNPLKEARVRLIVGSRQTSSALLRLLSAQGDSVLVATAGRQGEFELYVPAEEGSVTLAAIAPGYARSRIGPLSVGAGRARAGILFRLSRGLEAHGRVVDEGGTPVSGATVSARRAGADEVGLGFKDSEPRATSGRDGRFTLRGMEKGIYALKASRPGHATSTLTEVEIPPQTAGDIPDIVLPPEAQIKGRIADVEGRPIAGAKVSGVVAEAHSGEAISDDEGAFTLSGFAAGASVVLSASAAGYSEANKVVRAPEGDVVVVLQRHGALRGRVEDAGTLAPIQAFQIRMGLGSRWRSFRTPDGTFEWEDLPPGRWNFVAQVPGYQSAELAEIEIRAGEATEGVVFSVTKGAELAGRVVDAATGVGLPDATVNFHVASDVKSAAWRFHSDPSAQRTDAEGNFKFDGLPPGKVTLIAKSPLYAEGRRTVSAGEESFTEIRLSRGGSVAGRVVGSDALTPLAGAQVTLWDVAAGTGVTRPADKAGVFSFGSLAAGRYRLTADTKVGPAKPQEVVLRGDEAVKNILLVLKSGATIRGRVTGLGPDEHPLVEIVAQGPGDFVGTASTSSDGAYAIYGAPPGRVEVTAQTYSQRSISKWVEVPEGARELTLNIDFPRAARLSGRVTRGGQPVAGRLVNASPRDPELASGAGKTDQNGVYVIEGLSDGNYVVSTGGEGTRTLLLSGDTRLDIELAALSLAGRIQAANSGQPIPGVSLQVQRLDPAGGASPLLRTAVTDASGRFSVEGVEPGQYQLVAHKRGYKVVTDSVSVPAPPEFILSLTPAEGISIRVKDGISGLALRAVTVDASSDAMTARLNIALDETGSGELPQLAPGRYNLLVSSPGYAPESVSGWVVPGSPLDLTLTPGGRLEVHVDPAHIGAKASLARAGAAPRPASVNFALSHQTAFPHLMPGEYVLLVKLPEQTKAFTVSISEGQTTVLQVK